MHRPRRTPGFDSAAIHGDCVRYGGVEESKRFFQAAEAWYLRCVSVHLCMYVPDAKYRRRFVDPYRLARLALPPRESESP